MADFTKTGATALPEYIDTLLKITVCHHSANAYTKGSLVTIEVSGNTTGDEDGTPLTIYRPAVTSARIGVD